MLSIQVDGARPAAEALRTLSEGCQVAGRTSVTLSSPLRYAGYVEYGTRRMRAQPYLRPALEVAESSIRARLVAALPRGAQPVSAALLGVANDALAAAQRFVPVRTGALRASLRVTTGRRGA